MGAEDAAHIACDMELTSDSIWREFSSKLLAFLRRRAHNPSDADDLLQEVFLKVHTRIHTLRDRSRAAPWLYQIARNTLIDHQRKRRPTLPLPESVAHETSEPNQSELEIPSSLRAMVDRFPGGYRDAVALFEFQGLKQEEIAGRLGLSLSGAKSRVQRGRDMIRDALLDCCHFEFDRHGRLMDYWEPQPCCARCAPCSAGPAS